MTSRRGRRVADAHELLAGEVKSTDLGAAIARAIAMATGEPAASGAFFSAHRARISPVGVDDAGRAIERSTPSSLDLTAWRTGGPREGYLPFGYVRGSWLTVQLCVGDEMVGGAIVTARSFSDSADLRADVRGVAAHAAAILRMKTALNAAEHAAATDALTGVANRAWFMQQLARLTTSREPYVVFMIDIDGLKAVNDTQGHAAGDRLIIDAADALRRTIRAEEIVARMGGDEFTVLCRAAEDEAPYIARRLETAMNDVGVSASFGFAPLAGDGDLALATADISMYEVKRRKRDKARRDADNDATDPLLANTVALDDYRRTR
jgi:diguanylate cyclase (GGDEF)-like protein